MSSSAWSFEWGDALWGEEGPEVDEYKLAEFQLLPKGPAWDFEPVGVAEKLLRGLAFEFAAIEERVRDLVDEIDPLTTYYLLSDWERIYGLPDLCYEAPATLEGRRIALKTKMTQRGVGSLPFFLQLAESLGYADAEILSLYDPFTCESECTDALYGFEGYWKDAFLVLPNATTDNDDALACEVENYAQAHEVVVVGDFGLNAGRIFRPNMASLVDAPSGQTGAATGTTYVADEFARLFAGSGSGDRITFGPIGISGGSPNSMACWFLPLVSGDQQALISIAEAGGAGRVLQILATDQIELFHDGATDKQKRSLTAIVPGVWTHVAMVDEGGDAAADVTLYLNGVAEGGYAFAQDGASLDPAADDVYLGYTLGVANPELDGSLREGLSIWNRVITPAEVLLHMRERPENRP